MDCDEKRYTERDLVLAKREGYECAMRRFTIWGKESRVRYTREAYPLPKVTRPRMVTDQFGRKYRLNDGTFEVLWDGGWQIASSAERVSILRDLLANPTEEVPCDE